MLRSQMEEGCRRGFETADVDAIIPVFFWRGLVLKESPAGVRSKIEPITSAIFCNYVEIMSVSSGQIMGNKGIDPSVSVGIKVRYSVAFLGFS